VTYLVDANVLSEATKPKPAAEVVDWLRHHERDVAVDPIILGEIRFGIYLLPAGGRRRRLERWFAEGVERIRCLPWEAATGIRWAKLLADLRATGRAMPIKDSLIAATALVHGLVVATRNTRDFKMVGVKVVDPFGSRANGRSRSTSRTRA
jgi:toxin FitB